MSASQVTVSGAVEFLQAELKRRQAAVDDALAVLDGACCALDEVRGLIAGLGGVVEAEAAPPTERRRGRPDRMVTWNGQTLSIWQWSQLTGIRANTIYLRLKRGWAPERTLTEKEHEKGDPAPKEVDSAPKAKTLEVAQPAVPPVPRRATTLPQPASIPPSVVSPKVGWTEVVAASQGKAKDQSDDDRDHGDGDDSRAATEADLKAEVARQQAGNRQQPASLGTTMVKKHRHTVRVDFFGDGNTIADSSGHVHRVNRFVVIGAHGHMHELVIP